MKVFLKRIKTTDFILSAVHFSRRLPFVFVLIILLECEEGKGNLSHHHGECNNHHQLDLTIVTILKRSKFYFDVPLCGCINYTEFELERDRGHTIRQNTCDRRRSNKGGKLSCTIGVVSQNSREYHLHKESTTRPVLVWLLVGPGTLNFCLKIYFSTTVIIIQCG